MKKQSRFLKENNLNIKVRNKVVGKSREALENFCKKKKKRLCDCTKKNRR